MKKLTLPQQSLYDGFEKGIYDEKFEFYIKPNKSVVFTVGELINSDFEDMSERDVIFKNNSSFVVDKSMGTYNNEDSIALYYLKYENYLLIFAYGEVQPARYNLSFEEAWLL